MLEELSKRIEETQTAITLSEKLGNHEHAVFLLLDLMALVRLKNAYRDAMERGLI